SAPQPGPYRRCVRTVRVERSYHQEIQRTQNPAWEKQRERRDLTDQKQKTGTINPIQHIQLSRQITTLTEEIEELKSRKTQLMYDAGCHSAAEMKDAENTLAKMADYLEKLDAQQTQLTDQLDSDEAQFLEMQKKVDPNQNEALLEALAVHRNACEAKLITKLRDKFSTRFRYDRLDVAAGMIDSRLGDNSGQIQDRSQQLEQKQQRNFEKSRADAPKRKYNDTVL
ncbi:MAG: hypothetical protein LUC41_03520, partial [Clostridiales bacterium]|nr:hypothetical protein [Clostridiales bacterium]